MMQSRVQDAEERVRAEKQRCQEKIAETERECQERER